MDLGVDLGVERKWVEAIGGRIERLEIERKSNLLAIGGKGNWLVGDWDCDECGYLNLANRENCVECGNFKK